jgi:addiction module HigA family antidote
MVKSKPTSKTPGAVLQESFLDEYGLTPAKLAEDTGLSQSGIRQILTGKTRITLNVAVRLSTYFGNPLQYWLDLQTQFDLAELRKDSAFTEAVKKIPKAKKQTPAKKAAVPPKKTGTKKALPKQAGTKAPAGKPRAAKKPKAPKQG